MNYNIISTGSKGNAVIINNILVDCGVPYKSIADYIKHFNLVLLTHRHTDHFKTSTLRKLAFEKPSLRFGCCEWLVPNLLQCGVEKSKIDVYEIGKNYFYGDFSIMPIKLYHDVSNCGYRLFFDKEKAIYATDTRTLEGITAADYDYYFIEANYKTEEIKERIEEKQKNDEFAYELRAQNEHLSYEDAINFIYANIGKKGKYIFLHGHTDL